MTKPTEVKKEETQVQAEVKAPKPAAPSPKF